jgi:hypothetical protein
MLRALHCPSLHRALPCALVVWFASAVSGAAQGAASHKDRAQTSGLALAASWGAESPLVGGEVLYYFQLQNPRLHVALHAGAGGVPSAIAGERSFGVAGGAFFGFGRRHRFVAGISGGTQDWWHFSLHGEHIDTRPLYGAALLVGWELVTQKGFLLHTRIGPSFYVEPETPLTAREVQPSINGVVAIGYKLW